MKYIRRTSKDIKSNFLHELLLDRGIISEDSDLTNKYFKPTMGNLLPNENLDNIEEAYNMLMKHLKSNSKICIIVDCD